MTTPTDTSSRAQLGGHLLWAARREPYPVEEPRRVPCSHSEAAGGAGPSEQSQMFSLDALTARAHPGLGVARTGGDDSGLIDLRALAGARDAMSPDDPSARWADAAAFPLGRPAVEPAAAGPAAAGRQARSRRGSSVAPGERLLVGVLAATAVLLGTVVVLLLVRPGPAGSIDSPRGQLDEVASRASGSEGGSRGHGVQATADADERPAGESERPVAPAERVVTERPTASAGQVAAVGRPAATSGTARPVSTQGSTPAANPVTASACPCPPDDLMCHMRCAVRK